MTVYNQGTIAVSGFEVTNYFHALMSFDGAANPTWVKDGDYIKYAGGALNPGQQINIPVKLCVKEGVLNDGIVNFAEISSISVNGLNTDRDFDSRPDSDSSNDAGGT